MHRKVARNALLLIQPLLEACKKDYISAYTHLPQQELREFSLSDKIQQYLLEELLRPRERYCPKTG
ncbi:MAG: hypothetical protein QNJ70_24375 [Xenococcaceae cyanobacterium MO_207.B15]|nr:hypothetical protein [Xenococcaceae cyanobacterium MO_207.B15]